MSSSLANSLHNGKYILQQLLGQGSLYTSYRAICVGFDQPVVIVKLNDSLKQQPDFMLLRKAFATEAKRIASCKHPHLIRLLELFLDNGILYLVMEYIPGQSLTNIVRTAGALTVPQALRYIRQAGSALSAMHQRSILHRNLT
ncbi:MAG: protein kinase, partial [Cyanobacteria bacterium]|nr:protein kinase [Cyanobacteriota bacterium]MDW8202949.1 protein kinase [Cyanobacteriota bacterium SKYGB_h_bin112]